MKQIYPIPITESLNFYIMGKNTILSILIISLSLTSCIDHRVKAPIGELDKPPIVLPVESPQVDNNLPTTCVEEDEGPPVITSITSQSGAIGGSIVIGGCNLSGFEGDKHVWIESEQGIRGIMYGEPSSTSNSIQFKLRSPLCQSDTSYSGLKCESFISLIPGKYTISVMPWGKKSNSIEFIVNPQNTITEKPAPQNKVSYQDIIDYLEDNITDIITKYSKIVPSNGKWFTDGFGFISTNFVYTDYEDGHYLYRALLECDNPDTILICRPLAIFEKQKGGWILIQGEDSQKNNEIVHTSARDYKWKR